MKIRGRFKGVNKCQKQTRPDKATVEILVCGSPFLGTLVRQMIKLGSIRLEEHTSAHGWPGRLWMLYILLTQLEMYCQ